MEKLLFLWMASLSFDHLLMRIHPAAGRIEKLSHESPCVFIVFDLLVDDKGKNRLSKNSPWNRGVLVLEKFAAKSIFMRIKPSGCLPSLSTLSRWRANGSTWELHSTG